MISWLLALPLLAIAALHAYWGFGGVWPGTNEASCARTIAGFRGISRMPPPWLCFAVAAALAVASVWPRMLLGYLDIGLPRSLVLLGGLALTTVFLARGLAGYLPAWRRLTPEQPFARLDREIYSPLCLLFALQFALSTWQGWKL